jgi:hypothetical protein
MSVKIQENNAGTIKAYVSNDDLLIGELCVEAEVYEGDPGQRMSYGKEGITDWGQPSEPATCEITRVFVEVGKDYDQKLDMLILKAEIATWEAEIIEELEKGE